MVQTGSGQILRWSKRNGCIVADALLPTKPSRQEYYRRQSDKHKCEIHTNKNAPVNIMMKLEKASTI